MSKPKFTPGPWAVHGRLSDVVVTARGGSIADCVGAASNEEKAANARLIAVAPGMLETLIYLDKMLKDLAVDSDVRVRITAAIDFATGGGK